MTPFLQPRKVKRGRNCAACRIVTAGAERNPRRLDGSAEGMPGLALPPFLYKKLHSIFVSFDSVTFYTVLFYTVYFDASICIILYSINLYLHL